MYSLDGKRIWVAGHRGMAGAAIMRRLGRENCTLLTTDRAATDLRDPRAVRAWIDSARPDVAVLAAARVGGIVANDNRPADFLYDNLMIEANVVHAAAQAGTQKLLFLGSSCIYPKHAEQPIREEALLSGPLEATNEVYAIAKIAGIKLCQAYRRQHGCDFIVAMPPNLYGPGDNYHPENSHVMAGLIRRAHEAKAAGARWIGVWGTGAPRREFLHVDDLADAAVHLLRHYSDPLPVNVGWGVDLSVRELTGLVCEVVGFRGDIVFDSSRPDGTPRKLLDVSRMAALGWRPRIALPDGVQGAYADFLAGGGRK